MRALIVSVVALLMTATVPATLSDAPSEWLALASTEPPRDDGRSWLEQTTGQHYQHDAHVEGDAPGTCEDVDHDRIVEPEEEAVPALLVEEDDERDAFHIPIGSEYVGERLRLDLLLGTSAELNELSFDIVDADCGFSVFDPDAPIYRGNTPPSEPFEPRPGFESRSFEAGDDHDCNENEWKFMLKHTRGHSLGSLYVEWSNGAHVTLQDSSPTSQVAKFYTSHDTEHTISRIVAEVSAAWDGTFKIAHGPCELTEGEPTSPPSKQTTSGEFTVVQSGNYVLLVTLEQGPVGGALDDVPQRCHREVCFIATELIAYDVEMTHIDAKSS